MISKEKLQLLLNSTTLVVLLVLGAVLVVAAGAVFVFYVRETPTPPPPEIVPPQSLVEVAEQYPALAEILADPELDSVYKEFLVAYEEGGRDAALELARERDMLTPDGDVAITLILDTQDNTALISQLEASGVTIASAYQDRINIGVPIVLIESQLQTEEPGAIFEQLTELEHVIGVQLPEQRIHDGSTIPGEGVAVTGANTWHQAGVTGAGLRIGVLDLGFANYQDLLGVELPDNVPMETFGWYDGEEVHGTACAEIVHEVAPDAELFFAWYDGSDAAMGEAVDWLLGHGVNIISHSASGIVGPRDGSEWDARLVDDLSAQGILWVNSSGNEALSHYRAVFTDQDGNGMHEFAPGEESLALYNNGYVDVALTWDDDWSQAGQDYELFLYDMAGNELASSQNSQGGNSGDEPVEWISYETGGDIVYAVVTAYEADQAVTFDIFVNGADVARPSPDYSVCPPGDAVGSLTVGAANWQDDSLADYSSQGPTTDGRLKPEISAPTGVSGATYGATEFHGTSSSCPHVAGAAALVWQANPDFGRQEVVDFLLNSAVDVGPAGPDTGHGYGRLQLPPPSASNPAPRATVTPIPESGTEPVATTVPLPTPTQVVYATPEPPPPSTRAGGVGLLALTGMGLLAGGLCCAGGGLLLVGGIGMIVLRRRAKRAKEAAAKAPRPRPSAPPPPPQSPTLPQPARCPSCGADKRPGAHFCPECGRSFTPDRQSRRCPQCNAELRAGARFCSQCGKTME